MRFKLEIQERYQTHQDEYGQAFYAWRPVCQVWASFTQDGLQVKTHPRIKPGMRAIGAGRVFMIGKITEFEDGGTKFLKLKIDSVRGDYARTRDVPKATVLPFTQDQTGSNED